MTEHEAPEAASDFMTPIDKVLDGIALLCRVITGVSIVVLTVIFGWLVFGRYVLNATPTWVEQAALLLVMVITFLGAAVGVHEHTHLSVAAFRTAAPRWLRMIFVVCSDIGMLVFGLLMLIYGAKLTAFKWGSMIPLIDLPEGLRSLPLTIGGGLIMLFSLAHLVRIVLGRDLRSDTIQ
ncbi:MULTISPECIES: TRAP transporter small permease [Halocynthiibacter]|uniref:TRAP transporter small permease protein n=1 Tax=Halocynthiibacter halioticoli TaxID=2986804 RepID=A0AAE3IXF0_9RHOB|nr:MULTISPECIES: TRAP transporter small permease [Halocynthiibacter]MCV6824017.1 TRAP transporter small permease [Halocynthiibacter halioticoli]MCW4057018.1 TRAP transporter small permease [Halocynthiibacter sp. SDUM655004]